ncbi:hypothetical protein B0A49_06185 [Cryomyces minteri]|uniref:Phosphatidic acid phosphatase type 2/haloperoxidase domain-containing protein n=1 Tax=Cryomyces minteri TaxID=331657 RepID=A0A4U0WY08_9PEZI|nr:hypothetical protein B0A49_06185 [Cryomyces minteri]
MSGSAALEYGFPSTHSTNAVSVAVYVLHTLYVARQNHHTTAHSVLRILSYCYAISIILGRLYCGMHGFLDVVVGSVLGAGLTALQCAYGEAFDDWMLSDSWGNPLVLVILVLLMVRLHPEPADDCPCFDDSVAFAGVLLGVELGHWHYARSGFAWDTPMPATVPFNLQSLGWVKTCARIFLGVLIVFAWRGLMKPALLKLLPPVFRVVEQFGLTLPRKFFMQASQYESVPPLQRDDNVIPSAREIPSLLTLLRHPRKRAVSIGPQSEADAYETLNFRHKRRRESLSSSASETPWKEVFAASRTSAVPNQKGRYLSSVKRSGPPDAAMVTSTAGARLLPSPAASRVQSYERMMGMGEVFVTLLTPPASDTSAADDGGGGREDELEDRELFSMLEKPRVRYDVEVITKLIVYFGTPGSSLAQYQIV